MSEMANETYDIAVIGAGTGGLVAAFLCDSLGAKTALIEKDKMGGECLWTGCVPSKTLIRSAKVLETVKRAEEFGVHVENVRPIWRAIQLRMAAVRDEIKTLERQEMARTKIDFINGNARFLDARTLEIQDKKGKRLLHARKFILATGTKAKIPAILGLSDVPYLTHETIYDLPSLPRSLAILGGGPIACEFAQAFARFGAKVTILQKNERLLPREDGEISAALQERLQNDLVQIFLGAQTSKIEKIEDKIRLSFEVDGQTHNIEAGHLLLATGKEAQDTVNFQAAGVQMNEKGVIVDEHLKTTAPHIWACGDITGAYLFTHVAEYQGKIAAQNALLPVKAKADYRIVPWTTFTDPEVAHLGLTEEEARQAHGAVKIYKMPFDHLDRAIIEGETSGFLKAICTQSGRLVGAHIIGPQAGELIHTLVPAVRDGALIQELAETIHVYPTLSEIGHRAGNQFYKETLDEALESPPVRWLLKKIVK
jgi:pyruvate/2-oxoglutarate dehydrogenase complex dihydrolipoamide dehydrogenase (E3) component